MKERPILFSAPMVSTILFDSKTQTRRAVKPTGNDGGFVLIEQPDGTFWPHRSDDGESCFVTRRARDGDYLDEIPMSCPCGQPGDRLWVRETWALVPRTAYARSEGVHQVLRADDPHEHDAAVFRAGWNRSSPGRWRPSIHMPRWASRIDLEVTGVRVERLQDISEADSVAEGIRISSEARHSDACYGIYECQMPDGKTHFNDSAYHLYRTLWEQINGAGSWAANPWVWVVEFRALGDER